VGAAIGQSIEHLRPWMPWIAHEPLTEAARVALIRQWDELYRSGDDVIVVAARAAVVTIRP
jgi:hypothetical protein